MKQNIDNNHSKVLSADFLKEEGLSALSNAFEMLENEGQIDNLICLGTGFELDENGKPGIKDTGRMNILAALALKYMGVAKNIIITGGKTAGEENPSESGAIAAYIESLTGKSITELGIKLEEESKTTIQNAEFTSKLLQPNTRNATVSTSYHKPRAVSVFKEVLTDKSDNLSLNSAFSSNKIIEEFVMLISRNITEIRKQNPEMAEVLWRLTFEMKIVTHRFNNLPILDAGGVVQQNILRVIYNSKFLRPVRNALEQRGSKRGDSPEL